MKKLTLKQAAYINWLNNPPKFYCRKYGNALSPPDNAKGWYCTKQCAFCKGIVTKTRLKNKK